MNLYIRSQDRKVLACLNTLGILFISEDEDEKGNVNGYSICNMYYDLGTYRTEERALEVLDEIHQRLLDLQTLESSKFDATHIILEGRNLANVYEMPKG